VATSDAFGEHLSVFRELISQEGRRWLASLPALVTALEDEWDVRTGPPFTRGTAAWTAPATTADGTPAVLKVSWPHREARDEAEGLHLWAGAGAVKLLESDPARWAMLLERCQPGIALDECGLTVTAAMEAAAGVVRQLWSAPVPPGAPFERLGDVTAEWAELVRERMARHRPAFDPGLVALGASLLETLPAGGQDVLLHGDFNPGNILSATRAPFLAIDAKPMVGDAAYDPPQLLTQIDERAEDTAGRVRTRFATFARMVEMPADRMLAWGLARSVEGALWDVDENRPDHGARAMRTARMLADAGGLSSDRRRAAARRCDRAVVDDECA
jgi:streptomycin 6-kinase